jgi:hypothetical protein
VHYAGTGTVFRQELSWTSALSALLRYFLPKIPNIAIQASYSGHVQSKEYKPGFEQKIAGLLVSRRSRSVTKNPFYLSYSWATILFS